MSDNRPNLLVLLASLDATPRGTFDVRIVVDGRVIDIDSRYTKAHDALTSALMLGKRAVSAPKPARASIATSEYAAPEPTFIPDETLPGDSGKSDTVPQFEMERAADKPERKVLGAEDIPEIPDWLNSATGLAREHHGATEGW